MTTTEPLLRKMFRSFNRHMVFMWRLGLGWQMANATAGYIMVLGTTGRKTGQRRLAPLNFSIHGDTVYCLAGYGDTTHWLLNLMADPRCEVWLPDGRRLRGQAEHITTESLRIQVIREVLGRSGFAAKLAHPGMDMATVPEATIAEFGPEPGCRYEAVEITLGGPILGEGGPGDLSWVWPVAGLTALSLWMIRRRLCRE